MATPIATPARSAGAVLPRNAILVLAALAAPFVLAIGAIAFSAATARPASSVDLTTSIAAAAATIDQHGQAMIDHGQRLSVAARASTGPNREHWIADGAQMVADGQSLLALAARLRAGAALLGNDPLARQGIDLTTLAGEATVFLADGQAAADHGRAMIAHADAMVPLAKVADSGITLADVEQMRNDAAYVVGAGESVRDVGAQLRDFVDKFQRSLGR